MLLERLMAKVDQQADGCWIWTAMVNSNGYGQISDTACEVRDPARLSSKVLAHRASYTLLVGPIPEGLELDHLCRVRRCVRPEHLEPVTTAENIARSNAASVRNARKTHCPEGHPLSGDNLAPTGDGTRQCWTCRRERMARRYQAEKEAAAALGMGVKQFRREGRRISSRSTSGASS